MTLDYIVHLANYSDGVLYVLAFLLLGTLAVSFDRFWHLRRTILRGEAVVRMIDDHDRLDAATLDKLAKDAGRLPEAAVIATALDHLDENRESLSDRMDETIMRLAPRIDRGLWILDTIVTLAPLLGLFGTIIGMFHAFSVLASPGHAPTEVTSGVADALVATASGIFIAMLGLATFNTLSNQVRLVLMQLDTVRTMVLNRLPRVHAHGHAIDGGPLRAISAGD